MLDECRPRVGASSACPLAAHGGGWIVQLGYELGGWFEPTARSRSLESSGAPPLFVVARVDRGVSVDDTTGRVLGFGGWEPGVESFGEAPPSEVMFERPRSRRRYESAVARAVEYIRAGDVFQANIAHHLEGRFRGSPRAMAASLMERLRPAYGAYVEHPGGVTLSVSPELFLRYDAATGRLLTRPIKGTRAGTDAGVAELGASEKDAAELAMIVDLMRNDLGRVAQRGSVRVDEARAMERHARGGRADGVVHGVGTVSCELRADATLMDVLAATFPPGSITGAPKVRAMQVIDELEQDPRGAYCGAIGYISDAGDMTLNVAIRTLDLRFQGPASETVDGTLGLGVGAGIVADSTPDEEWRETLVKAAPIVEGLMDERPAWLDDPGVLANAGAEVGVG